MTDTTGPTTAALFESYGIDPATAAAVSAAHEAQMGRGDALAPVLRNEPAPQAAGDAAGAQTRLDTIMSDRAAGRISDWEWRSKFEPEVLALRDRIVGGMSPDMAHLEQVYAPPAHSYDYKIPPAASTPTDEAIAADRALVGLLHTERVPADLGNAVMLDLAAGRPSQKSTETVAALRPWAQQMLSAARADPKLAPVIQGFEPDHLIALFTPATAAALLPFVRFRAARR
jgi:hypothetical protein